MTVTARQGGQTVDVSGALASGLQRRYKITSADARPVVEGGTVVDLASGWLAFPLDGQINGAAGQVVTVVDCTVNGSYARAKGEAVLPAPLGSVTPTSISVTPNPVTLKAGSSVTLDVKVLPEDADQSVTAASNDPAIVTVKSVGGGV